MHLGSFSDGFTASNTIRTLSMSKMSFLIVFIRSIKLSLPVDAISIPNDLSKTLIRPHKDPEGSYLLLS
mgnify:CR=1 FL=1